MILEKKGAHFFFNKGGGSENSIVFVKKDLFCKSFRKDNNFEKTKKRESWEKLI